MKTRALLGLGVLFAVLVAAAVPAGEPVKEEAAADVIRKKDGSVLDGVQVLQDDFLEVKYKTNKTTASVKVYDVDEVEYGDAVTENCYYLKTFSNIRMRRWAKAVKRLEQSIATEQLDKKSKKVGNAKECWGKEYVNFWLGYCEFETGAYAKAREHLATAIEANPKSRFLFEAMVRTAMCYVEEKDFANAEKTLDAAKKRFTEYRDEVKNVSVDYSKFGDRQLALCELARARMYMRRADMEVKEKGKGDYDRVRSAAQSVISMCRLDNPDMQAEAKDLVREALIGMRRFDDVVIYCNQIISEYQRSPSPDLLASLPGAYVGLGDALFGMAVQRETEGMKEGEQGSKFKFAEARDKYLRVIVEYFDNQEFLAKANYMAGMCCKYLPDEKDSTDRAVQHWKTVVRDFPDSAFKQPAEQELAKAGASAPKPDDKKAEDKKADDKKTDDKKVDDKKADSKKVDDKKPAEKK